MKDFDLLNVLSWTFLIFKKHYSIHLEYLDTRITKKSSALNGAHEDKPQEIHNK